MKVEVLERVELGCTGPRERNEAAKSGSRASSEIADGFSLSLRNLYRPVTRLTFVLGLAGSWGRMDGWSYDRSFWGD